MRSKRGITLIALVITIIVLLILAGVTIATLTGDNGLLKKATEAKEKTEIAELMERVKLDLMEGLFDDKNVNQKESLRKVLNKYFNDVPNPLPDDLSSLKLTAKNEYGGYVDVDISELASSIKPTAPSAPIYNAKTLTIGTPINTDKYGWKVKNYQVATNEFTSGVWRLFYQDANYTYIITDDCIGDYFAYDHYDNYKNGANVSEETKRLNLGISSMFSDSNFKNQENMTTTAWLTDTSESGPWAIYKNSDAAFAIGCPTAELFVASYNNRSNKENQINLVATEQGYYTNAENTWFKSGDNHGIYNKGNCWIASPCYDEEDDLTDYLEMNIDSNSGNFSSTFVLEFSNGIRPIVCIPTSIFNSKYGAASNLVNE